MIETGGYIVCAIEWGWVTAHVATKDGELAEWFVTVSSSLSEGSDLYDQDEEPEGVRTVPARLRFAVSDALDALINRVPTSG